LYKPLNLEKINQKNDRMSLKYPTFNSNHDSVLLLNTLGALFQQSLFLNWKRHLGDPLFAQFRSCCWWYRKHISTYL